MTSLAFGLGANTLLRSIVGMLADDLEHIFLLRSENPPASPRMDRPFGAGLIEAWKRLSSYLRKLLSVDDLETKEDFIRRALLGLALGGLVMFAVSFVYGATGHLAGQVISAGYAAALVSSAFFALLLYVGINVFAVSVVGIVAINIAWLLQGSQDLTLAIPSAVLLPLYCLAKLRQLRRDGSSSV